MIKDDFIEFWYNVILHKKSNNHLALFFYETIIKHTFKKADFFGAEIEKIIAFSSLCLI